MATEQLPDITLLNAKLAGDNARISGWVDGLVEHVDQILAATMRSDWMEVKRLSVFIAESSKIYGFPLLADNAHRLMTAADYQDETEIKRGVIKLIGAVGRTRKPVR